VEAAAGGPLPHHILQRTEMNSRIVLPAAGVVMIILAIVMGYLGLIQGSKIAYPPLVTGIGFLVIGAVFLSLPNSEKR
jgi:lipopolysaccharide export LptBFGC system permease protein LptF